MHQNQCYTDKKKKMHLKNIAFIFISKPLNTIYRIILNTAEIISDVSSELLNA